MPTKLGEFFSASVEWKKFHWSQEEKDANSDLIFLVKDSWAKLLTPKMEGSPLETPRERSWQVFRIILNVVSTAKPEIDP